PLSRALPDAVLPLLRCSPVLLRRHRRSTLFPYTTLFRSEESTPATYLRAAVIVDPRSVPPRPSLSHRGRRRPTPPCRTPPRRVLPRPALPRRAQHRPAPPRRTAHRPGTGR